MRATALCSVRNPTKRSPAWLPRVKLQTCQTLLSTTAQADRVLALLQCEAAIFDFREQEAGWIGDVREAPTFRPSREEFADPLAYIASIQTEAARYGQRLPTDGGAS